VAERFKDYIRSKSIGPDQLIFPIGYTGARAIVKKAGNIVGIDLNPLKKRTPRITGRVSVQDVFSRGDTESLIRLSDAFCISTKTCLSPIVNERGWSPPRWEILPEFWHSG